MFTFKIFEIPEGKSERTIRVGSDDLDLDDTKLKKAIVQIEFERGLHFIRTVMDISAEVELICDRSLDPFDFTVNKQYEILFKEEEVEESVDENSAVRTMDTIAQEINIEQDVHDTILVNLPVKKLHPRFLDEHGEPLEFEDRQFGKPEKEEEKPIDPRWEALKKLKN